MASGSKVAGLRQFFKVRSSKRDFVERCTFHVVAHYCSFVCYRNLSFIRTVERENVRVLSLKRLDRLVATVR